MKKLVNITYLIGILVAIMFTLMRSSLPAILMQYQILIVVSTIILVGAAFVYDKTSK